MRLPSIPVKLALLSVSLLALAGLGATAWGWKSNATRSAVVAEPAMRPARVMEIAYHLRGRSVTMAGTVVPRIEATLGFRVAGKIVERLVDVGATVQPGQAIARLDPTDYRLAVDNARAALVSAEADWQRAKADHERYQALRNSPAFMAQTAELRQSTAATAEARVEQARSQLATAENNLAYTTLHADAAGVVTAVVAEVGQVMAQGQGVFKVARTEELEILVGVPENRLAAMRQIPGASFELWSDKGHKYAARLRELSPSADPVTRTYPARFTVVERPAFIGLGMTATLTFERSDLEPVANVPLSAIFQHGTQPAVWVVDRTSGEIALRDVVIARWRDDTAAILSGVKEGELIATAGVHKLEPGQKVRPLLQQAEAR
ncbi:MAG TPA: efflux RND transporter periplasmic adaptor subunit [Reyranella sp.]|nr:efflux RND transporter periplasmic adaptor subunit [Reyranella sp.]